VRLQVDISRETFDRLLEADIVGLPEEQKWAIRGHGTRSRDVVRRAITRRLEKFT
jgi:hypothetical protein